MDHYRVTLADAIIAHEVMLKVSGGRHGVTNLHSIEGALARPYHGYHTFIYEKAAALLHGLATSHGFADANKRTAWIVTNVLIYASAYDLQVENDEPIDDLMVDVVNGDMTEEQLVLWFKARLVRSR